MLLRIDCLGIEPVVQNPAHGVRVGARRNALEEITARALNAIVRERSGHDGGRVEKNAAARWMRVENRDELRADAAADIGDHGKAAPIAGRRDSWRNQRARRTHRLVEYLPGFRPGDKELPRAIAVQFCHAGLARLHAIEEFRPGVVLPESGREDRAHKRPHRAGHALAQAFAVRSVREDARRSLREDANAFERAHHAEEAWCVGLAAFGKRPKRKRAARKQVGDLEFGGDGQRPALPEAADDFKNVYLRRHCDGRLRGCGFGHSRVLVFRFGNWASARDYTLGARAVRGMGKLSHRSLREDGGFGASNSCNVRPEEKLTAASNLTQAMVSGTPSLPGVMRE